MESNSEPVGEITFTSDTLQPRRVRLVDWHKVLKQLDEASINNPGDWGLVGEFDQSLRTHIRQGRYKYIDPAVYEVTTRRAAGKQRSRALLYMRKKPSSAS
jgi:hypothetical protein